MNFDNIKFETRAGRSTTNYGLYINGNNWVPEDRIVEMWEQAQKKLPLLDWSYPKPTKSFFDSTAWKEIKRATTGPGALPALFRGASDAAHSLHQPAQEGHQTLCPGSAERSAYQPLSQ